MPETTLSDGDPIRVRTLGIFELDGLPRPNGRPFTYQMRILGGETKEAEFDIAAFDEPPGKPEMPEEQIREGSGEWHQLRTWQLYQAGVAHEHKQFQNLIEFREEALAYIIEHCIAPEDVSRIVTEEDWEKVYWLALVPQLTREKLAETLNNTYSARFADEEIFDALEKTAGGQGVVNGLRLWENEIILKLQMTEVEYATLPLDERARKVCAHMLSRWLEHLEIDSMKKDP